MNLDIFIERLLRIKQLAGNKEHIVGVVTESSYTIGGRKTVAIKDVQAGFDWEHGKILLMPQDTLTALSVEDVSAIVESKKNGQSWHSYQQHKKHEDVKRQLEKRVLDLESALAATRTAAETLCDAVENMDDLAPIKFAARASRASSELRRLLALTVS